MNTPPPTPPPGPPTDIDSSTAKPESPDSEKTNPEASDPTGDAAIAGGAPPLASVVLVMQDGYAAIAKTVEALAQQTIVDRLELVVVAPAGRAELPPHAPRQRIGRVTVVELGEVSLGEAQSHGTRAASAAVVILGEDHAWPEPEYAQALAESCVGNRAAVGPAMINANPWSTVSWSNLLLAYGPWTEPVRGGVVKALPGTNTAYQRSILMTYGQELDTLMAREGGLLQRLRDDGYDLYLEPRARTAHQNVSGLRAGASLRYHAGRLYAARRAETEGWGGGKRAVYAAASPLIPLVRFRRIFGEFRQRGMPLSPRRVAGIAWGVTMDGLGQLAGFGIGAGGSDKRLQDFEYNRYRYLSRRDRREAGLDEQRASSSAAPR